MNKYEVATGSLLLEPSTTFKDNKFGFTPNDDFIALMLDGDELKTWEWYGGPLCARGGFCIIRDGKPIYAYSIWMS